ncbi:MAG: hypothetical protein ACFFFC_19530 [Candidatus Thorarchaeota archaeon]
MRTLRITNPQAVYDEPVTLTEVENYLALATLTPRDEDRDFLIKTLISGARQQAEILQNRDLVTKGWDLYLDRFPGTADPVKLRADLVSVSKVQYKDSTGSPTTLTENTDYIVDVNQQPGVIVPAYGKVWPSFTAWPSSPILIQFTSGMSTVPEIIQTGMLRLISEWFNNRLPFEVGSSAIQEYPYAVTAALRFKSLRSFG